VDGGPQPDVEFAAFATGDDDLRGTSLAVGNVSSAAVRNLLIGAPGMSRNGANSGGVFLAKGGSKFGSEFENDFGAAAADRFGLHLLAPVDLDGDGRREIVIAAPGAAGGAGRIEIRFGPGLFSRRIEIPGAAGDQLGSPGPGIPPPPQ
jgi:hypothetical protein